jgi:Zn-dependent membrane protease YugP
MSIWIIIIGFAIVGWYVQYKLKSKFEEYSKKTLLSGISGQEAAERMLRDNNINDVRVICVEGELTDHYNPANKTVNLSKNVYYGNSAAAVAVAAHECGHAVQHAKAYAFLKMRSAMVPVQALSSQILNAVMLFSIFGGLFVGGGKMNYQLVILVIIACYSVFALFSLITLPVEFDASHRALVWLQNKGVTGRTEHAMAKDALKWAAMTYVVAALSSMAMLAYYVMIFMNGRRND